MAHSISARKRVRQNIKRRAKNRAVRAEVKTSARKIALAIKNQEGNVIELYKNYVSRLDKALKKGVLHKNYVGRRKSRLLKNINLSFSGTDK